MMMSILKQLQMVSGFSTTEHGVNIVFLNINVYLYFDIVTFHF